MQWVGIALGFLGGVVAATIAALVALRTNQKKIDADTQAHRDAALLEKASAFAEAARSLRHHAEQYRRASDKDAQHVRIDEAHERLRGLTEQLRLVGTRRVQKAARVVLHHAYAVRMDGEKQRDPRQKAYPGTTPATRLNDALQEFYRSVRAQLRTPDPEIVIHNDREYAGFDDFV